MKKLKRMAYATLERLIHYRTESSIHRLLRSQLHASKESGLFHRVIGDHSLTDGLRPVPLDWNQCTSLVVLAPHSDDEAIGAGGLLLAARSAGLETHVISITDSAAEKVSYAASPEEAAALRAREADAACAFVGAARLDLDISCLRPAPSMEHVLKLRAMIRRIRPEIIAVPWLLDRPPQHRMCSHLLALALENSDCNGARVLGYQVHSSIPANRFLDIGPWIEDKRTMLGFYNSQLLARRHDHIAIGMAAFNSRFMPTTESGYAELFHEVDAGTYRQLTFEAYLPDLSAAYGARPDVEKAMRDLQAAFVAFGHGPTTTTAST